jgi:hypothetical protein
VSQPPPPWYGPSFSGRPDDAEGQAIAALERDAAGGAGVLDAGQALQALDAVAHHASTPDVL